MLTGTRSSRSSRHGSRSVRTTTRRSRRNSQVAVKEQPVVRDVDPEDVRRVRNAYFGAAVAEKRKVIRPASLKDHSSPQPAENTGRSLRRQSIKTPSKTSVRRREPRQLSASEDRTAEYVYGQPIIERIEDHVPRRKSSSTASSRRKYKLPTVTESEVTPDDSISVVAERRHSWRSSFFPQQPRPAVRRSSTTTSSSKLRPVPEGDEPESQLSRKPSKRNSSLLGSLFGNPKPRPSPPRLVSCLTCGSDDIPRAKTAKLSCNHRMCHSCLRRIFTLSINDPSHMPPRCCTSEHIPLHHVAHLFDSRFKTLWNKKYQEYHTRNRIYCPARKCGQWIKPARIHTSSASGRKSATCPRCRTKVCPTCSGPAHRSAECPRDPEIARLVAQGEERGWQRCYSCRAMVELQEGCNHMTCRCTAEFCMKCGAKWKTCECTWFNYAVGGGGEEGMDAMRVPEEIRVIYRRGTEAGGLSAGGGGRTRTYRDELDERRRQEREDEELARRWQLATLIEVEDYDGGESRHGHAESERPNERSGARRRRARRSEQDAGERGLTGSSSHNDSKEGSRRIRAR